MFIEQTDRKIRTGYGFPTKPKRNLFRNFCLGYVSIILIMDLKICFTVIQKETSVIFKKKSVVMLGYI